MLYWGKVLPLTWGSNRSYSGKSEMKPLIALRTYSTGVREPDEEQPKGHAASRNVP